MQALMHCHTSGVVSRAMDGVQMRSLTPPELSTHGMQARVEPHPVTVASVRRDHYHISGIQSLSGTFHCLFKYFMLPVLPVCIQYDLVSMHSDMANHLNSLVGMQLNFVKQLAAKCYLAFNFTCSSSLTCQAQTSARFASGG